MSIRSNYYLIGETVEVSGSFLGADNLPVDVTGASLIIRRPDDTMQTLPLNPVDGVFSVDIDANIEGIWNIRLENTGPTKSARESKFFVVKSAVLPSS